MPALNAFQWPESGRRNRTGCIAEITFPECDITAHVCQRGTQKAEQPRRSVHWEALKHRDLLTDVFHFAPSTESGRPMSLLAVNSARDLFPSFTRKLTTRQARTPMQTG